MPDSNRARSGPSRWALWRAASSSEPISVGRMIERSSESGFSEPHDAPQLVAGREAQGVEQPRVGEAPADDLERPRPASRSSALAAHPLSVAQEPRGAARARQRRGQPLEPIDAGDLLDQVDLAGDVSNT